jgi:ribosomal-protein-alanine N-acetyltransferase
MDLSTRRLRLREFVEDDAAAANAYESLEEVVRYQSHPPRTLEQSLAYIRTSMESAREVPRTIFDLAVELREERRLIGRCGLKVTDWAGSEGMLWYVLHPAHWGKGYIVEAAEALLDHGFVELGLHRVVVDIEPGNRASRRVAEKLGMRQEAHFVENAWIKGRWTDSVIYALLDREWRAKRG